MNIGVYSWFLATVCLFCLYSIMCRSLQALVAHANMAIYFFCMHYLRYYSRGWPLIPADFPCWLCWKPGLSLLLVPHAEERPLQSAAITFPVSKTSETDIFTVSSISYPLKQSFCSVRLECTSLLQDMVAKCYKLPDSNQLDDTLNSPSNSITSTEQCAL